MTERSEGNLDNLHLIEAPDHIVHGLALVRDHSKGIIVGNFLRLDVTSIEPEVLLVRIRPIPIIDEPAEEQILKWCTPYNFEGTDNYLIAELDMHPLHTYPRARIKLEFPRDVSIMRDELAERLK